MRKLSLGRSLGLATALTALAAADALACTTFLQPLGDGAPLVAKSYDWHDGGGMLVANKRGVDKVALPSGAGAPLAWRSRFASLTFNQFGREQPHGGINEAGLVVEIMWLDASQAAPADGRPTVSELQWIQQALDRFATVAELSAAAPEVRIAPVYAAVHYLACDATGACAAVELVGGEQVVTSDPSVSALTNHTLADARSHVQSASRPDRGGHGSLSRYARVAGRVAAALPRAGARAATFAALDSVEQPGGYTKWQIVYDTGARTVSWRTHRAPTIKTVALADFPGECTTPVTILDVDHASAGAAAGAFRPYTTAANRERLESALGRLGVPLPGVVVGPLARYPESTACAAP